MVDLRLETVKQAAGEVAKTYGVKTLAIAVDVASYEQVEKAVQATVEGLGGLHCAFNAAGLPGREGPGYMLADYPVESWSRMINVNCDGVFYCCKAQISHFMKTGTKGSIVNVSSTAAERVFPACAAYGGSPPPHLRRGRVRTMLTGSDRQGGRPSLDPMCRCRIQSVRYPYQRHRAGVYRYAHDGPGRERRCRPRVREETDSAQPTRQARGDG